MFVKVIHYIFFFVFCSFVLAFLACTSPKQEKGAPKEVAPFCADSAYHYVSEQVALGPRYPGSDGHYACTQYLRHELSRHGAAVLVQQGQILGYDGKEVQVYNIIGQFNPEKKNRILLCAHYDSRPWADEDDDIANWHRPILGANDGASGVGVLLEIARQLGLQGSTKGVDIVFFDAEDMGTPTFYTGKEREHSWCLGAQLWAADWEEQETRSKKQEIKNNYQFGILLDMVGAADAVFPKEYFSMQYAGNYVEKVWQTAAELGYSHYFQSVRTPYPITDDHYYVNLAGIPCIDIIHYNPTTETGFAPWWHTMEDDMRNISKETLEAVGKVVLTTIMN